MPASSSTDHLCEWRDYAKELEDRLLHVQAQVEALQRHVFGKRSEKMPPIAKELRASGSSGVDPTATQEKRRKRADERKELPTREIPHKVPEAERSCGDYVVTAPGPVNPRYSRSVRVEPDGWAWNGVSAQGHRACRRGRPRERREASPGPLPIDFGRNRAAVRCRREIRSSGCGLAHPLVWNRRPLSSRQSPSQSFSDPVPITSTTRRP